MEEGMGYLGKIVLASPPILGTPSLPTDDEIAGLGSTSFPAREWTHSATKFLIELVKERIESFGTTMFKQQNWERIKEQILKEHPSEARRTWTQIRDKWDKPKRHYHKEKKLHNVTGDNAGSQWIWFNTIDEVLSSTAKADGVPGGMDNGEDVGVEEQVPAQEEEATQQGREEGLDYPRTRAANLPGVRGQHVKRRRLASDMPTSLDRFCESIRRSEELKLEATVKMHKRIDS
jgi:hypothetical protein